MVSVVLKSGIWYTASNIAVKAIGFITIPIFTRLLTQDDFGAYNNFYAWTTLMSIIVSFSLDATIISAKHDFRTKIEQYVLSMAALSSVSALLWLVAVNVFSGYAESVFNLNIAYVNCIFIYTLFMPIITLFQTWERYRYEYKWTVATGLLVSLSTAVLSVALVYGLPDKLTGRIIGQVAPVVVIGSLLLAAIIKKGRHVDVSMWKYALPIALPFIPHLISVNLLGTMDKIMLPFFCGYEDTAIYSLAFSCGMVVTIISSSIISMLGPWLSDRLAKGSLDSIRKKTKPFFVAFSGFAVLVSLLAPELVYLLGGAQYADASYILPPIILSSICQFAYSMYGCVEQFKKKTGRMALATVSAVVLKLIFNFMTIPFFGYIGAAYTTLLSYLWLAIAHVLIVRRMGYGKVYDTRFVFSSIAASSAACLLATCLYGMFPIRALTIAVIAVVAAWFFVKNKQSFIGVGNK